VKPEARRTAVFNSGTPMGSTVSMPTGGQIQPSSWVGVSLEWKNVQKKEKKKQTSLRMNNIIPMRRPCCTGDVCFPIIVAS